ncbi:LuxR C-terminal-related transcriptional regulator [Sanguibacter sp. 4.1]|uniref:LuxR C-terminal-related transcriptional regulator n=1 Tax=Sanguibacter biliveldensis TaxID=3030830 RepID=A0AAF0Z421_9MICO|nr:LuxR C-terminal-related transcriptional regulator [Sanguibacter sp. 4.1]WPF81579.1 LuxR C-terminal-related transcriptional regulator [Sanguibacter sp. 4.1]
MSWDSEHRGAAGGTRPPRLPRSPSVLVGKPALTSLLDRHEPLTVICAPKGYGKTALVSSWARARTPGHDLVWVSCRLPSVMADGMPAPFWARLAAELWRAGLSAVEPGLVPGRSDVVAALTGRTEPLCVVVDDFDDNPDPHVAGEILELVQRFDLLYVVVLARSPRTTEPLLASTVDSVVLGPQDLLLGVDDTTRLVAALGHDLSGESVRSLVRATGGWAALLRAVLVGSGQRARPGGRSRSDLATQDDRPAVEATDRPTLASATPAAPRHRLDLSAGFPYLRSVWDELADPALKRFVQRTAFIGAFTVDDATWTTGLRDCAEIVCGLVDVGLLVQETAGTQVRLRYVEAVALAATEIFRAEEPRRYRVAQRRMARLRTTQGRVGEAVEHLLEARTWEACAELVDSHWATLVAEHPEVVADVVERVPATVLARHPRLGIAHAHLLPVLRPRRGDPGGAAHDAARGLRAAGPGTTEGDGTDAAAQALGSMEEGLAQIVTLRLTGDYGAATHLAEQAQVGVGPILDGADSAAQGELAPLLYEWAVTRFLAGDVEDALSAFRQGAGLARSAGRPLVLREAAVGAALCCALLGYLAQAEEWLLEVPAVVSELGRASTAGRTAEGRGVQTVRAIVALERLEPSGGTAVLPPGDPGGASGLGVVVIAVRSQIALRDGTHYEALAEVEAARQALEGSSASRSLQESLLAGAAVELYLGLGYVSRARAAVAGMDRRYEAVALACARTDLVAGDLDEAVDRCTAWLATHLNGPRMRLDLLLVLAAAELGRGHRHEAAVALEEAVALFRATGLLRSFLKVPREVLEDLAPQVPAVRAVLDAPGFAESDSVFPGESPRARLSSREMQVLRSLAESPSLAGVARSLFLSANTVKTHLRSIYQKLGTHSSVETVEKARDLGLLDDPAGEPGAGGARGPGDTGRRGGRGGPVGSGGRRRRVGGRAAAPTPRAGDERPDDDAEDDAAVDADYEDDDDMA